MGHGAKTEEPWFDILEEQQLFSFLFQFPDQTGSEAHPNPCVPDTRGYFHGGKMVGT
jgi:hypothetical protein